MNELRNYIRIGNPKLVWAVHIRRIYSQEKDFVDNDGASYQVLHEWDMLPIPADNESAEYYAVIAILGVEYTINLGGSELDGYLDWLERNDGKSYLYTKSA